MKLQNKMDVAQSQLEEAIKLLFENRDPVSIHTLVGAAHQIMRDVASANGVEYKCLIEEIPEREQLNKKGYYRTVLQPCNFFKHADNDTNLILDFDPEENVFWEPVNAMQCPEYVDHRDEVELMVDNFTDADISFVAYSYDELWIELAKENTWQGLDGHLANLRDRYKIAI